MALEKLHSPPIVEVVCGVLFDPIPQLDALTLGKLAEAQKAAYPTHQLHPPILDDGQREIHFNGTFPPIRVWLVSENDAWVVQMQWDRFYLNWRARGGTYPRFSDKPGNEGVLSRFLREFSEFTNYCRTEFSHHPEPRAIELTKIDHFQEGTAWKGVDDLADMLPWLAPFAAASKSGAPSIAAQFREDRGGGVLSVGVDVGGPQAKLESRLLKKLTEDLRPSFEAANGVLNEVFENLIPEHQRRRRFMGGAT